MWQEFKNSYHLLQGVIANLYYGFPGKDMTIIGVTGTDGKTTTVSLIYHILESSGKKASLLSTLSAVINGKSYDTGFHVTTPSAWSVQKYLKKAKDAGSEYFVMEVTSHGLDQNRVWGIPFAIGVLTNITHEHLDYHKTYERYVLAKTKLLKNAHIAIINKDDETYKNLESIIQNSKFKGKKLITYGLSDKSDVSPKTFPFETKLFGEFNLYNCLAAIGTCMELGISEKEIRTAIITFTPPVGREEIVYDKDFKVMIDFAHTPNSIEKLLQSIKKEMKPKGRIIHVFGSAGRRDSSKRSLMGKASDKYADIIILTAEDPRDEKIEAIIKQINEGILAKHFDETLFEIPDRQEAINKAVALVQKNDIVVITGKGHERSLNLGHGEVPWSDHEAVKKALELRNNDTEK